MDWVKLSTRYYADPKVASIDDAAEVLFLRGLAYAGDQETRGFIPDAVLPQLSRGRRYESTVKTLVEAGLWVRTSDGHRMPAWSTWQSQLDVLAARRARDRDRQRRRRAKDHNPVENPLSRDSGEGGVTHDVTLVSHPTPPKNTGHENAVTSDVHATSRDGHVTVTPPELELEKELPKGGMSVEPSARGQPPPRRCPKHEHVAGSVPPCGACADARRAHDTWRRQHDQTNGARPSPLDEFQRAARAEAERLARVARGEECQACYGKGIRLDDTTGEAVPCRHEAAP